MTPTQALTLARDALDEARTYTSSEAWSPSMTNDCEEAIRAIDAALSAAPAAPAGEPVAWGLFAKVEDGSWNLQHPVRFSEADAKADRSMYERGTALDVRPLYAAPAPAEPAPVPAEWLKAVQEAYGWLWNINDEPLAPIPMLDEGKAAYQARKALRDLLTSDQRGEAINAVRGTIENMLAAAPASPKG